MILLGDSGVEVIPQICPNMRPGILAVPLFSQLVLVRHGRGRNTEMDSKDAGRLGWNGVVGKE